MKNGIVPEARAALFDIDGTLTTGGWIWRPLVTSRDVALMRKVWLYATAFPHYGLSKTHLVSQAGFRDRWVRLMAWLVTGWSHAQVRTLCHTIVREMLIPNLRADVVEIATYYRHHNRPVILVSTMFDAIVTQFSAHLAVSAGLGSVLAFDGDVCRGKIVGETCSGERKVAFANRLLAAQWPEISLDECAAYADSSSDIALLSAAGFPVAVYPDSVMQKAAHEARWTVYTGNSVG